MRVRVIGCSPAFPDPGGAHAGYLVSAPGEGSLLLDCGPGVLPRLRAGGLLPVDAIAITHLHLDHWGDLVPWCWLASYGPGPALPRPALWLPPGGRAELGAFAARFGLPSMLDDAFAVREYGDGAAFEAAGFDVEAIRVAHYGMPAWGLRVTAADGRVLAYSGDSGPCPGLDRVAAGADLLLCEATLPEEAGEGEPRGHLRASEALALPARRIVLTHRPVELPTPPGAERAVDGLELEV